MHVDSLAVFVHAWPRSDLLHFKQVFSSANATSAVLSDAIMTRTAIRILPFSITPKKKPCFARCLLARIVRAY
jgi:hypothetical protein